MTRCPRWLRTLVQIIGTLWTLLGDSLQFLRLCLRFPTALAAENLFLRKQLALSWLRVFRSANTAHLDRSVDQER